MPPTDDVTTSWNSSPTRTKRFFFHLLCEDAATRTEIHELLQQDSETFRPILVWVQRMLALLLQFSRVPYQGVRQIPCLLGQFIDFLDFFVHRFVFDNCLCSIVGLLRLAARQLVGRVSWISAPVNIFRETGLNWPGRPA